MSSSHYNHLHEAYYSTEDFNYTAVEAGLQYTAPHSSDTALDYCKASENPDLSTTSEQQIELEEISEPSWYDKLSIGETISSILHYGAKAVNIGMTLALVYNFPLIAIAAGGYFAIIKISKNAEEILVREAFSSYAVEFMGSMITSSAYQSISNSINGKGAVLDALFNSDQATKFQDWAGSPGVKALNILRSILVKTASFSALTVLEYSVIDSINSMIELTNFAASKVENIFSTDPEPSKIALIEKIPNNLSSLRFKSIFIKKSAAVAFSNMGFGEFEAYFASSFVKNIIIAPQDLSTAERAKFIGAASLLATSTSTLSKFTYETFFWYSTHKTIEMLSGDDSRVLTFAGVKALRALAKTVSKSYFDKYWAKNEEAINGSHAFNSSTIESQVTTKIPFGPYFTQEGYYPGFAMLQSEYYLYANVSDPDSPSFFGSMKFLDSDSPVDPMFDFFDQLTMVVSAIDHTPKHFGNIKASNLSSTTKCSDMI